jgi:hypothetical protein
MFYILSLIDYYLLIIYYLHVTFIDLFIDFILTCLFFRLWIH